MVEQRQKVDASLAPGATPIDVTIVGPVPVPVSIPVPVPVVGEAGAGDPVLVEGVAGGVPVPVSVVPGAPVVDSQDVDFPLVAPGGYMVGWIASAATISPGRVIFQIYNKSHIGVGYGVQDVEVYVDVMLAGGMIDANIPLYTMWPGGPTLIVPADDLATFEVDSFLAGVKLDISQVAIIVVSFICPGANKFYATMRVNGDASVAWDGTVI